MRFLMSILLLFIMCMFVYADDDQGLPDIYLPGLFIYYTPPGGGGDGDGTGVDPSGPIPPTNPDIVWVKPSTPQTSGCDYWKISGTLEDGTPFEVWMQKHMTAGMHPEDKCDAIKNAVNYASDYHTSGKDPVNATVNPDKFRVEVRANNGSKITGSEFDNNSNEEDNETGSEGCDGQTPESGGEVDGGGAADTCTLYAYTLNGIPTGDSVNGGQSFVKLGTSMENGGYLDLATYIEENESHEAVLKRFKLAMKAYGIDAKLGTCISTGKRYLLWENSGNAAFGTDDTGTGDSVSFQLKSPKLNGNTVYKVGSKEIKTDKQAVDPDEAMPHYADENILMLDMFEPKVPIARWRIEPLVLIV